MNEVEITAEVVTKILNDRNQRLTEKIFDTEVKLVKARAVKYDIMNRGGAGQHSITHYKDTKQSYWDKRDELSLIASQLCIKLGEG